MAFEINRHNVATGEAELLSYSEAQAEAMGLRRNSVQLLASKREATTISLGELLGNMVEAGWINETTAENWVDRVALPAPLVTEIQSRQNPKVRIIARATFFAASAWRMDPVWNAAFARFGKTDEEVDLVFGVE